MRKKSIFTTLIFFTVAVVFNACQRPGSAGERAIKSTKSGEMTITISSSNGALKRGINELMITFADSAGKPVDVGAASLNFHMAAMGSMAEMNDKATLTTTDAPGKYHAKVDVEMAGTWEAQVKYQGPQGAGETAMTVQAK